jgi:hypothetical protein
MKTKEHYLGDKPYESVVRRGRTGPGWYMGKWPGQKKPSLKRAGKPRPVTLPKINLGKDDAEEENSS